MGSSSDHDFFINSKNSTFHSCYQKNNHIGQDKSNASVQCALITKRWHTAEIIPFEKKLLLYPGEPASCGSAKKQLEGIRLRVSILQGCGCTLHTHSVYQPNTSLKVKNFFHRGKSPVFTSFLHQNHHQNHTLPKLNICSLWKVTESQ